MDILNSMYITYHYWLVFGKMFIVVIGVSMKLIGWLPRLKSVSPAIVRLSPVLVTALQRCYIHGRWPLTNLKSPELP